jgi:UDP-3-O-[3-hydroxymyristoyl] glucosamine N-acyltransferase
MSLNRLPADWPQPEIASSAVLLGSLHIGSGAVIAQGTDDVVIGPGAMIHGCHVGRGRVVEPAAIVCDFRAVGPESIVRAGARVSVIRRLDR